MATRVLVTGAGGFIGHHLVRYLVEKGYWVRGVDIKYPEYQTSMAHEFIRLDLRNANNCRTACKDIQHVYHLAADMGGIGYISGAHATVARNNTLINIGMLDAARAFGAERFFFSSTACVYNQEFQKRPDIQSLREQDAHPAAPEEGYGWEKLYMEKLCEYYLEEYGLQTRVARFHNVYGPLGTYDGGREKAPAAVSRKVARAKDGGEIEVWGDGEQTRSFTYIDDCVEGVHRILNCDYTQPINLGSEEMVTVNQLVDYVSEIAGKKLQKRHDTSKPQGVRGRNSDNTLINKVLGWAPSISLREGLKPTYRWIESRVNSGATAGTKVDRAYRIFENKPEITVFGLGKLGSPMAACFAASGYNVTGVDVDANKVNAINAGKAPVTETNLVEMLDRSMGRLKATQDGITAAKNADLIFMIVPTPSDANGTFSLKYTLPVCETIGKGIRAHEGRPIVVITSTVMPGDTGGPIREVLERASGKKVGEDFGLVYSPEFIALGSVIHDFLHPDFYLIGESDKLTGDIVERFYSTICQNNAPAARMNFSEAELAKISINSYVTMKITYANTLARICERFTSMDVDRVTKGIGYDNRIGEKYLRGAIGYGGPCFPRDNRAFGVFARSLGLDPALSDATDKLNKSQATMITEFVKTKASNGAKVAVLGLSYKPETDMIEESQAVSVAQELAKDGYKLSLFDPLALSAHKNTLEKIGALAASAEEAVRDADLVLIMTPWREFKEMGAALKARLDAGSSVIDCWRMIEDPRITQNAHYFALGRTLDNESDIESTAQGREQPLDSILQ